MSKTCSKCGKTYPTTGGHFSKGSTKDGLHIWCKICTARYYKEHREKILKHHKKYREERPEYFKEYRITYKKKHADRIRNSSLKSKYNITLEQYGDMFAAQGGVCAVCGKPETVKNQYGIVGLSIDHDHKTGKVRGLLCQGCNIVLGYIKDDVTILLNAGIYLEKCR